MQLLRHVAAGSERYKDTVKWRTKQLTCQPSNIPGLHHPWEFIASMACNSDTVWHFLPASAADVDIKLVWNGFCLEDDDLCFEDSWTCCSQSMKLTFHLLLQFCIILFCFLWCMCVHNAAENIVAMTFYHIGLTYSWHMLLFHCHDITSPSGSRLSTRHLQAGVSPNSTSSYNNNNNNNNKKICIVPFTKATQERWQS